MHNIHDIKSICNKNLYIYIYIYNAMLKGVFEIQILKL
jgi:hypothetical protein